MFTRKKHAANVHRGSNHSNARAGRLLCQVLESRDTPSTYTVSNLNDNGSGSLRVAIVSANFNPGADTINFNVNEIGRAHV